MAEAATVIALGLEVWKRPTEEVHYFTSPGQPRQIVRAGSNSKMTGDFGTFYAPPTMDQSELPPAFLAMLRSNKAAVDEKLNNSKPN